MVGRSLPVRAARLSRARTGAANAPGLSLRIGNFALCQLAWLAAVVGAAQGHAVYGSLAIAAVLAWHLAVAPRPGREALLLAAVTVLGLAAELLQLRLGFIRYAGQAVGAVWPPPWLLLLWTLLGCMLNVSLRWLRGRPLLASVLAAIGGPAAFAGGVRLGAAQFVDGPAALASLAVVWALLMPLMLALAQRLDGVAPHA